MLRCKQNHFVQEDNTMKHRIAVIGFGGMGGWHVRNIQEKIPELEAALTAENWAVLDTLAHAVKGNALATGDNDSANAAIALRIAAKMSNKDEAHTHFEELKKFAAEI